MYELWNYVFLPPYTILLTPSIAWPFFISAQHFSVIVSKHSSERGQFFMGFDSHDGPFQNSTLLFHLAALSPRDPMSAGFSASRQWFHILCLVKDKILLTPFWTNCFYSFEPFIEQITVLLSNHKCVLSIVIFSAKASLTEDTNLA